MGEGPFLTLVITLTLELKTQWRKVLDEQEVGDEVLIITYAKAGRMLDNARFWAAFSLIILDEAHHTAEGAQWSRILVPVFKAKYALGLTSTPPTDPKNPLLRVLPIVYTRTFEEGLEEGYAAPLKTFTVPVKLLDEEREKYEELTDKIRVCIQRAGSVDAAVRREGNLFTARKKLVTMAEGKFEALVNLVNEINFQEHPNPTRVFAWSEYVDALEHAHDHLRGAGITSEFVHGALPKQQRREIFEQWGRTFQVLLLAKLGEEGLDVPECAHGVILAGARTSRQNVQRIGRLLRPMPGKEAKLWLIYAENTMEERLVDLIDEVTGS